jgi:hypothetical protein
VGRTGTVALIGIALAAAACPEENQVPTRADGPADLPRARDPDIAVQEELDAARRASTLAAYDLFLARHGEHRLAETARRERAELAARQAGRAR